MEQRLPPPLHAGTAGTLRHTSPLYLHRRIFGVSVLLDRTTQSLELILRHGALVCWHTSKPISQGGGSASTCDSRVLSVVRGRPSHHEPAYSQPASHCDRTMRQPRPVSSARSLHASRLLRALRLPALHTRPTPDVLFTSMHQRLFRTTCFASTRDRVHRSRANAGLEHPQQHRNATPPSTSPRRLAPCAIRRRTF